MSPCPKFQDLVSWYRAILLARTVSKTRWVWLVPTQKYKWLTVCMRQQGTENSVKWNARNLQMHTDIRCSSAYNKGNARKRVSLALIQQACWAKSRMAIQLPHDFLCLIHQLLKYSLNAKSSCCPGCSDGRSPLINDMDIIMFSAVDGAERPYGIRQFFHLLILVMNKIRRNVHLVFTESARY